MGSRKGIRDSPLKQATIVVACAVVLIVSARGSVYGWANTFGHVRAALDLTKYALLSPYLKQIDQLTNRIAAERLPNQEGERSNLLVQRAVVYLNLGVTEKAFADLSSAVALNPG